MRKLLGLTFAVLATSGTVAAPIDESRETVIPFASSLSNIEWEAAGKDSLYLRGPKGEWYFVRTMNLCTRLRSSPGIGIQTSALGQLDRHGAILVEGVRCPVQSITRSDGPPAKARRKAG
jgi:hypothetical protein